MANRKKYEIIDGIKECGKCHLYKSINQFNKTGKRLSSKCKSCINEYSKEYRQRPDIKQKISKYHKEYKKDKIKRDIINKRQREYNKTEKYKSQKNSNRRIWSKTQKYKAILYKGGKCIICGYNKCQAALDFHHTDPLIKEGVKDYVKFEQNKKELDKCVLVCCRCHREIHAGLINLKDYE